MQALYGMTSIDLDCSFGLFRNRTFSRFPSMFTCPDSMHGCEFGLLACTFFVLYCVLRSDVMVVAGTLFSTQKDVTCGLYKDHLRSP